jgi:hypothetical protein
MRLIAAAAMLVVSMVQAFAQATTTRSLMSLIAEGYEVKAMAISGQAAFFLQKGSDGWFCITRGSIAEPYSSTVGNANCATVKDR